MNTSLDDGTFIFHDIIHIHLNFAHRNRYYVIDNPNFAEPLGPQE